MANEIIRNYAKQNGVKMWQIANRLGYKQDGTLCRKMRIELDADLTKKMLQIIDDLSSEQAKGAKSVSTESFGEKDHSGVSTDNKVTTWRKTS